MLKKGFDWGIAFKKGLVAAAAVGAGLVAGAEVLGHTSSLKEAGAVAVISAAVAGIRAGMNWWKVNGDLADKVPPR